MKTTGFTLVELLVVIAILAILATVSVVGYTSYIASTEETAAKTEAASIADAIDVALVMNKQVYIEVTAPKAAVGTQGQEGYVPAVEGVYVTITRNSDGTRTYANADADDIEGFVKIAEIPAGLADGLSVDANGKLQYKSDKDVTVEVK